MNQYRTYEVRDGEHGIAVIPDRGGIITQWWQGEHQWLYLDQERLRDPQLSVRGGIPILFPICGGLMDNTYAYADTLYPLPQHGFARNLPWAVVDTQDGLTLELRDTPETLAVYPFAFCVQFRYSLEGQSLIIAQTYTNQGSQVMPFSSGFHPYFAVKDKASLRWQIPSHAYEIKDQEGVHPFSGSFDWTQPELDYMFANLQGSQAWVEDDQTQLGLEWDSSFNCLVFWSVQGKPFYCLEPWSSPRYALNTGHGLLHLPPGGSLNMQIRLTGVLNPRS